MKAHEIKRLINEAIDEVEFQTGYDNGEDDVKKLKSIVDLSSKAWEQSDLKIIKDYLMAIHTLADTLLDRHSSPRLEGYGAGNPSTDPKADGRWRVHYPSEKDWSKHKKSLNAVYEETPLANDPHEKEEVKQYHALVAIADRLLKLHQQPSYDEAEEKRLHGLIRKLIDKLDALEASEPDHDHK